MKLLTTAQVAEMTGYSEEWVRENAAELGGRRAGGSRRSPLRFDEDDVKNWWRSLPVGAVPEPEKPQRPGPRRVPSGVDLLPLPSGH